MANMNRRRFLKGAGVAAVTIAGTRVSGKVFGANERLNLAFIGVGGFGGHNLAIMAGKQNPIRGEYARQVAGARVAALCDVDLRQEGPRKPTAAQAFDEYPRAAQYHDYRRMLDEKDGEIDAVVVSAPNHIHAPASVTAMRMGKHVYCEKPGAHSVYEARVMAEVAGEQGVVTQLGTHAHATETFRRVVELVRSGAIGEIEACHIWLRSGTEATDRPRERPPVPSGLHWDLWLGPAPRRPYHPGYIPTQWHRWWDFGGGIQLGNMGCHYVNLPFWALDLRHPSTIEAAGPEPHPESAPGRQHVRYTFERGGDRSPLILTWTHGSEPPPVFAEHQLPAWAWAIFVGDGGMLLASYDRHQLWPPEKFADYEPPEPSIPPSVGHRQEWINACRGEGQALCHFGYSMGVTETVLLGNVAFRSGRKLAWNARQFTIDNAHEAEGFLRRGYRPGWTL